MKKERITYTSPLDALVAVSKQLSLYEHQYHMNSEQFITRYRQGELSDDIDFVEWSNAYQHYTHLHLQLEKRLHEAA